MFDHDAKKAVELSDEQLWLVHGGAKTDDPPLFGSEVWLSFSETPDAPVFGTQVSGQKPKR